MVTFCALPSLFRVAGTGMWKEALAAPLPDISFCPTGGVSAANAADYLGLANVVCVGGSWVAPGELIAAAQWQQIKALAEAASRV